jgi:hypothetical protein
MGMHFPPSCPPLQSAAHHPAAEQCSVTSGHLKSWPLAFGLFKQQSADSKRHRHASMSTDSPPLTLSPPLRPRVTCWDIFSIVHSSSMDMTGFHSNSDDHKRWQRLDHSPQMAATIWITLSLLGRYQCERLTPLSSLASKCT